MHTRPVFLYVYIHNYIYMIHICVCLFIRQKMLQLFSFHQAPASWGLEEGQRLRDLSGWGNRVLSNHQVLLRQEGASESMELRICSDLWVILRWTQSQDVCLRFRDEYGSRNWCYFPIRVFPKIGRTILINFDYHRFCAINIAIFQIWGVTPVSE